jgi:hypothetical protein
MKKIFSMVLAVSLLLSPVLAGAQQAIDDVVVKGVSCQVFTRNVLDVNGKTQTFFVIVTKHRGGPFGKGLFGLNQVSVAYAFLGADGALHSLGDPVVSATDGMLKKVVEGAVPVCIGGVWYYLGQVNRRPDEVNVNNSQQGGGAVATGGDASAAGGTAYSLSKAMSGASAWANANATSRSTNINTNINTNKASGGWVPPGQNK